jgi:hypothetical protein
MALSGTFTKNVNSHWRVRVSWSGSQSISGNYTDITMNVYWEGTDSYGTTYSSATKTGRSYIDGTREDFTFSAKLSGSENKLVNTQTKRVYHADNGEKSISLSASLDIELTLSGTYYGTVTASDSVTLNTIPRASTLTSSTSLTAGSDRTATIKSASSSFRHEIEFYVKNTAGTWDWIKQIAFSAGDTSESTAFSVSEKTEIFSLLAQRSSADIKWTLQTFDGSDHIGTNEYTGTVTAPEATLAVIDNPTGVSEVSTQGHSTVYIDQTITLSLPRKDGEFTHKVEFLDANGGNLLTPAKTGQTTSCSWTPSTTEQNTMYGKIPNDMEFDGDIRVTTYYNGVQVQSPRGTDINYRVRNAEPTFSSTDISYKDTNAITAGITLNDQHIVQNKSELTAYVNTSAQGQKGASIVKYIISINGKEQTLTTATGNKLIGAISASSDQTLSITAVDSRGFTKKVTKNVTVLAYSEPTLNGTAKRANSFGESVTLKTTGSFSSINGNNALTLLQYRYKEQGTTTYIRDWTAISNTVSGTVFTGANIPLTMDVVKLYDIEVKVSDKLTTDKTIIITVGAGQPIFFVDASMRSIGFNDFPTAPNTFQINGRIQFGADTFASNAGGETGGGALDLNNSDITRINGLFFNDVANNDGEGLHFLKTGKVDGSATNADYDIFYIKDGQWVYNNSVIAGNIHTGGNSFDVDLQHGVLIFADTGDTTNIDHIWFDETYNQFHFVADSAHKTQGNADLYAGRLRLTSNTDVDESNQDAPLIIALNDTYEMRIDGNEIMSIGGNLNLNLNGNKTVVGGGMDVTGNFKVSSSGGGVQFDGTAGGHIYLEFFPEDSGRDGWIGYGSAGTETMSIVSSDGNLDLIGHNATHLELGNDGNGRIWSMDIYNRTYSSGATMTVTTAGTLGRISSSRKYKTNIKDADDLVLANKLLDVKPKKWIDKNESYASFMKKQGLDMGTTAKGKPKPLFVDAPTELKYHFGLIAEELVEAGLDDFVLFEEKADGTREPEGLHYDRLWTLLIPLLKDQRAKISQLEAQVAKLVN